MHAAGSFWVTVTNWVYAVTPRSCPGRHRQIFSADIRTVCMLELHMRLGRRKNINVKKTKRESKTIARNHWNEDTLAEHESASTPSLNNQIVQTLTARRIIGNIPACGGYWLHSWHGSMHRARVVIITQTKPNLAPVHESTRINKIALIALIDHSRKRTARGHLRYFPGRFRLVAHISVYVIAELNIIRDCA